MNLVNISRATVENMPWLIENNHWLISVFSSRNQPPIITAPFGKILTLQFDDIERHEPGFLRMTGQQANAIADFVKLAEEAKIKCLWVHCDAGVCRSGAIVEAIALRGHIIDNEIANERLPNSWVFTLTRKALGMKHSWE